MSSQDSVIVLSEDEEEAEEYLKIHYQDSKRFIEIPLESNGKVLSKDITRMESRISALIIQKRDSKRMVKLKDGYVKEPKETWKNVKVYALLEENQEVKSNRVLSAENSYTNGTYNWNTRIKSEIPSLLTEETQNNNQPGITITLPSSSNVHVKQTKINVEAREMSTTVQQNDHRVPSSTVARNNDNSSHYESAVIDDDECNSGVEKSSSDDNVKAVVKPFCSGEKNIEPANCIMPVKEPTDDELLLAYKVSSLKELKVKLCRGNAKYYDTFHAVRNRFKRTMVAYPNNEFVRLIDFARRAKIMMKKLDSNANDVCILCEEDFSLKHLVSQKHADMYHYKFNADPPEVPLLLNPLIYEQYLDPSVLAELKIPEFIKLEESPQFLTTGNEFVSLKYILINRLLQGTLVMDLKNFSFEKIVFLRKNANHSSLKTIFKTKNYKCYECNKILSENLNDYIIHILSEKHLQKFLNQEEMNNICKAISLVKNTPNGYCFESEIVMETKRKRKQSSNNIQNGIKREKNS